MSIQYANQHEQAAIPDTNEPESCALRRGVTEGEKKMIGWKRIAPYLISYILICTGFLTAVKTLAD